jgi:hypothetical protein
MVFIERTFKILLLLIINNSMAKNSLIAAKVGEEKIIIRSCEELSYGNIKWENFKLPNGTKVNGFFHTDAVAQKHNLACTKSKGEYGLVRPLRLQKNKATHNPQFPPSKTKVKSI